MSLHCEVVVEKKYGSGTHRKHFRKLPNSFSLVTPTKVKIIRQPLWNSSTRLDKMNGVLNNSLDIYDLCKDINHKPQKTSETNNNNNNNVTNKDNTDAVTGGKIYSMWSGKLSHDKVPADAAWARLRKLASDAMEVFKERLNSLDCVIIDDIDVLNSLDYDSIVQKKKEIEAALFETEDMEIEFKDISKAYQNVAQFLPDTPERKSIKEEASNVRKRFYSTLETLVRKKEIFRQFLPLLEQYKELGSEVKNWLDATELQSAPFINQFNNPGIMLANEDSLLALKSEVYAQKDMYENFLEAGESLLDINIDLASDMIELKNDIDDVIHRWDTFCSNLEKCLNRLKLAKDLTGNSKKNDNAKIEAQIRSEAQLCTCHNPFQIVKVGDGKYTFGTSKIVRLLRIHGHSIVVRVGGGWEYLYDFLMKADPCRAKQALKSSKKNSSTFSLAGLDLTPVDKQKGAEFQLAVRRMSAWTPYKNKQTLKNRSGSLGSAASSSENVDTCDESSDSMNISTSSENSTPVTSQPRPTLRKHLSEDSNKLKVNNDKKTVPRRVSLIDRQNSYAEKRRSLQIT